MTDVKVLTASGLATVFQTSGPSGANGADGKTVITGSGAPSSGTGVDGDTYIDITNWYIYSPKAAGAWPAGAPLVGVEVVHHGTSTSVARPNAKLVYWIGTATPSNALAWDLKLTENI